MTRLYHLLSSLNTGHYVCSRWKSGKRVQEEEQAEKERVKAIMYALQAVF